MLNSVYTQLPKILLQIPFGVLPANFKFHLPVLSFSQSKLLSFEYLFERFVMFKNFDGIFEGSFF